MLSLVTLNPSWCVAPRLRNHHHHGSGWIVTEYGQQPQLSAAGGVGPGPAKLIKYNFGRANKAPKKLSF
jgi:hypothetical protein